METNESIENEIIKKRGFWLTAFLVLMFIANPYTIFSYLTKSEIITQVYPKMTTEIIYFMAVLALINIILAVGIWSWKKWGVFGFYCVAVVAFCINLYLGLGIGVSLFGLIGAVLIFFTTKKRWVHFS